MSALEGDVRTPRQVCLSGCGCRKGTDDADRADCACDGPCCMADDWGPDAEYEARGEWWAEQ